MSARWYDATESPRLCALKGCPQAATPRTPFCARHRDSVRQQKHRLQIRVTAEVIEIDRADADTVREQRHWYRGAVRCADADVIWCLLDDERRHRRLA